MQFQTGTSSAIADNIFRSVISGITATNSAAVLQEGEPVMLATATIGVGVLGQEVIRAASVTNVDVNRLCIGPVKSASISHEGMGLVLVYGVGNIRNKEAATVAVGDKLVPDLNSTATNLTAFGQGAWIARTITDASIHFAPGYSVIAIAAATAVSGTTGITNSSAFVRAL